MNRDERAKPEGGAPRRPGSREVDAEERGEPIETQPTRPNSLGVQRTSPNSLRGSGPVAAGRSHPPTLISLAERVIRDAGLIQRGDLVLCACSGGPDSMALVHVLAKLRRALGFAIAVHAVDHGLRTEAAAEIALARELAASLSVPFAVTRVEVGLGSNLQARARAARVGALSSAATAAGAAAIATGHTADDRAETFLLRMLRGAGPRGLAVLPPQAPLPLQEDPAGAVIPRPMLIRPLIHARRLDVMAHLERHRVAYAHDPSNVNPHFSRVRVRNELLPLLEDLSPGVVAHLCALADMMAESSAHADPLSELGRAQRQAIGLARLRGRRAVTVRVRGGQEISVSLGGDGRTQDGERGDS